VKSTCVGMAALAVLALGTATALAQPAAPDAKAESDKSNTNFAALALSAASGGDVQEDVEILRRLLDKSLTAVYGPLTTPGGPINYSGAGIGMSGMAMGSMMGGARPPDPYLRAEHPAPDLQGVYLKDYGVVYTVTLPPPPNGMTPGPTVGVVTLTPLSPWERTRKELRGEKIENEGKVVSGSPSLSEVILKVLADNGKNFTRLAEGERITVAVTFRDDAANGIYHPQPTGVWRQNLPPNAFSYQTQPGEPSGGAAPSSSSPPEATPDETRNFASQGGASAPPPASEGDSPWLTDIHNGLTLGDLHLKQQNPEAAISAYRKAEAQLQNALGIENKINSNDAAAILTAAHLYLHLAKGYESAGAPDASRKAKQRVGELSKLAASLTGEAPTAKTAPAAPSALPSKLIVTASKKLLDEVGSGKTSFEAFTKAATVEYVKPSVDKK
jgi:hypothetical protein